MFSYLNHKSWEDIPVPTDIPGLDVIPDLDDIQGVSVIVMTAYLIYWLAYLYLDNKDKPTRHYHLTLICVRIGEIANIGIIDLNDFCGSNLHDILHPRGYVFSRWVSTPIGVYKAYFPSVTTEMDVYHWLTTSMDRTSLRTKNSLPIGIPRDNLVSLSNYYNILFTTGAGLDMKTIRVNEEYDLRVEITPYFFCNNSNFID